MKPHALAGPWSTRVIALVTLAALSVAFWKFRILDTAVNSQLSFASGDMYSSYYPMLSYAFGSLREGHFPLWNPYQFCGEPFFAITYPAMLYPPHVLYLAYDVVVAMELVLIVHMVFGGVGMWALMRHWCAGTTAALCSAVTFMWSGFLVANNTMPTIFEALTWAPLTVYLVDRAVQGRAGSTIWLALAVGCQLLLGSMEVFVHTMYLCALLAVFRLSMLVWSEGWRPAFRRAASVLVALAAGVALASVQLLPIIELTRLSNRAPGSLSLEHALFMGFFLPQQMAQDAVDMRGFVSVGVLPIVALALALGSRKHRLVSLFALTAGTGATLLVFGGRVFELYYHWFPTGTWFRRPAKFLDMYCFAQAVLAGVAITYLQSWVHRDDRRVWTNPPWGVALGIGVTVLAWQWSYGVLNGYLVACIALLVLFGLGGRPSWRGAMVIALCILQGASLFSREVIDATKRPVQQPEIFSSHSFLMNIARSRLGQGRLYFAPEWFYLPGLTFKQGVLNRFPVAVDYESLPVARYATFFERAARAVDPDKTFDGTYRLGPDTRWRLMDLTSTKVFVMGVGSPGEQFMASQPSRFRILWTHEWARVFERKNVPPRAQFIPHARVLANPDEVLTALDHPDFDPRIEVILETSRALPPVAGVTDVARGHATITVDEPERVVVTVDAAQSGFLLLNDLFYPGWRAFVEAEEVPIDRANYLFRAVQVPAGRHQVTFEFRPASVRYGAALSGFTALLLCAAAWRTRRRGASEAARR